MNDTPLGQTVRIRSEDNKEMLKHFSPYENRIRREWAAFRAKKQLAEKTPKQIQSDIAALEMMIKRHSEEVGKWLTETVRLSVI